MTETLTSVQAAQRWAAHLPPGATLGEADGETIMDAICAGAAADEFTGLILMPELPGGGRQVFEFERGGEADRYFSRARSPEVPSPDPAATLRAAAAVMRRYFGGLQSVITNLEEKAQWLDDAREDLR